MVHPSASGSENCADIATVPKINELARCAARRVWLVKVLRDAKRDGIQRLSQKTASQWVCPMTENQLRVGRRSRLKQVFRQRPD